MNKENIYEIYRACRLCGVGAGYKMPIVQSIIDVPAEEVELRHKIKECLQLEVSLQDKMPPLICELCVDKVHDFYEFRKMCQETNKRTRMKLGLPLQTVKSMPEPESVLGVTEQIIVDSDEGEPLVKTQATRKPRPKSTNTRKEPESKVENQPIMIVESRSPSPDIEKRETRRKRAPSPKRLTRQNRTDEVPLSELQDVPTPRPQPRSRPAAKPMLSSRERLTEAVQQLADEEEDDSLLVLRHKRPREVAIETPPGGKKPKLSEPVQPEKTPRPGPKSSKEPPKPTPPQKPPPKAGPKSKKRETSPPKSQKSDHVQTPGPKSRKSHPEEESVKSKNTILVGKSKPEDVKSKSKVETPQPAPKSTKRAENSPGPLSRTKKRNLSPPAPKSKIAREASPAVSEKASAASRASPAPQKAPFIDCTICGHKVKGVKGLPGHMKSHVVTYTPSKLACNACELWFPSSELANNHHRRHTAAALPYTCNKCYDDFKTDADYELHFTRNQCLPTYEVPDVKCDECWKMFATYKLLEDHRCLGEGGRPGGKCPNCKRTYATLKSLTMHELRCTVKKKAEPQTEIEETPKVEDKPLVDTIVKTEDNSRGMLPMKVRIVRCDLLLSADRGRYDVQGLSRKFGLDRNCTYPYLLTVKSKPSTFGHMVSITDDIKQEYMNEDDAVDWDSDDSDDNKSISNKSVDSLSNISLKTLFSQKCLGKVSKEKRRVKLDADTGSALANDGRDSAKSRFDHLIKESNSDNDSDSILDRNVERKADSADLFDSVKNLAVSNALGESKDMTIDEISDRNIGDMTSSNIDELDDTVVDKIESNDHSNDGSQNNNIDSNENSEEVAHSQTTLDEDIKSESKKCKEDSSETENVPTDDVSENDNINNSTKNGHLVSNKVIEDESLSKSEQVENGKPQTEIENMDVDQKESRDNDDLVDSSNLEEESRSNDENVSNLVDSSDIENKETTVNKMPQNSKGEDGNKLEEVNRNLNNIESLSYESNKLHESGDSFVTNGETNENDKFGTDDGSSCTKNDKIDKPESSNVPFENDDKSHRNDDTYCETNDKVDNNDLSEANNDPNHSIATKSSQKDLNEINSPKDDTNQKDAEQNLIDSKESLITENELFETEKVRSVEKFDMHYLDEEDKLLMAELDAQIGENVPENKNVTGANRNESGENRNEGGENSVIGENSAVASASDLVCENSDKKYTSEVNNSDEKNDALAALMERNDMKSLDLDSISDEEFNFDI